MTTPPSSPRTNVMENIEHVVVLMMENRSLDSLLGWLYERDRPLHNIPALNNASDRAYDGLHGLDLSQYINEAGQPLKQSIEMSLRGVLAAAKWTGGNILNKDAQRQRQALIQQLIAHSSEDPKFFASKSDDELIGMAGAIIYLLGHGDRGVDGLRRMSVEDHRNTLITVLHWVAGPAYGGPGGEEFIDDLAGMERLAGFIIRSGSYVDAIQAVYERKDRTTFSGPQHGGNGGQQHTITFAPDEVITEINGYSGSDGGYEVVRQLVIKTNRKPAGYGRSAPGRGTLDVQRAKRRRKPRGLPRRRDLRGRRDLARPDRLLVPSAVLAGQDDQGPRRVRDPR